MLTLKPKPKPGADGVPSRATDMAQCIPPSEGNTVLLFVLGAVFSMGHDGLLQYRHTFAGLHLGV